MKIKPVSFNGNFINTSTFDGYFDDDSQLQAPAQAIMIQRAGARPVYAGKKLASAIKVLKITVSNTSLSNGFVTLNQYFNVDDDNLYDFVVVDEETGTQYSVEATPLQVNDPDGQTVEVVLGMGNPVWEAVTASTSGWSITTSPSTKAITVAGNAEAYPTLTITPTSSPGGTYGYFVYVIMTPQVGRLHNAWPLELTGGWDTAALISGGKMQSDGDDIRVIVNGHQVDHWISDVNTTASKLWVTLDIPPSSVFTLADAVATSGTADTITFTQTNAAKRRLNRMPNRGLLLIENEVIAYKGKTVSAEEYSVTPKARGKMATTSTAHTAGTTAAYVPYAIQVKYGDATASAKEIDDVAPIIDRSQSTNASWVYSDFRELADADSASQYDLAPGSWHPVFDKTKSSVSGYYTTAGGDYSNPAGDMGMILKPRERGADYVQDTATITWVRYFPPGVTSISSNGRKYTSTSKWVSKAALQSSLNNEEWVTEWNEAIPTTLSSWEVWTNASETVPAGTRYVRFRFRGGVRATTTAQAAFEVADATVNMTSPPTVSFGSEQSSIFDFDCKIQNLTTGEMFKLEYAMDLNDSIVVDTNPNNPRVTHDDQLINGALTLSSVRAKWLKLANGSNTLQFTQTGTGNVTIDISWKNRVRYL